MTFVAVPFQQIQTHAEPLQEGLKPRDWDEICRRLNRPPNRAELSAEEADLIKKREILDLDEFRVLAKAFDEKAVRLRQEQQAKIQAITAESSRRRQDLLRSFVPVLSQVMRNRGATVLLDRRSVVLDDRASVDITDVAIMIIDQNTTETDAATDLETPAEPNVQE
ncbi:MAG: hypothetical protein EBZ27_02410 [Rhodobacteraceae bacterium]|nr:hypothetical protein [Paracoccaceae bacterium]